MKVVEGLRLADEVWLAVVSLHQKSSADRSFSQREIVAEVRRANLTGALRPGIAPHVHLHLVANVPPNPGQYRMLFRLQDGTLRLYRPDDPAHPDRHGKMAPRRDQLPRQYHHLLDWYEKNYATSASRRQTQPDFIERLSGLGKPIWEGTTADEYISELRKGWD